MSAGLIVTGVATGAALLIGFTYWGTYNGFQRKDERVSGAERQVASCYQKRADLITNQAATVERFFKQEKDVVIGNAQTRASGNQAKLPDNATAEQISEFIKSQNATLARLTATVESVPNMASSVNTLFFQRELKQVEGQCNLLRNRYIDEIQRYNVSVRSFPANIVAGNHGYTVKKQIQFEDEATNSRSPRVFQSK